MAWSKTETQITWSSSDTKSISAGSTVTSDKVTLQSDTVNAFIKCTANNSASPVNTDNVDVAAQFGGDPDVDTTEEMDSVGDFLTNLDTTIANPATRTVPLFSAIQGEDLQLEATNNSGDSNSITVGFTLVEERWS